MIAATAAFATAGFDSRIRILGYEPRSGRIYYEFVTPKGEPQLPHVLSIEPGARDGAPPVEHALWGPGKTESDLPEIYEAIWRLAAGLEPLAPLDGTSWRLTTTIVEHDTIQDKYFGHEIERFGIRLRFEAGPYGADTTVTAYLNRTVAVYGLYEMPGKKEAVVHFTFTGDPFETGYLTDALLVLPRRAGAEE
jgi:hypothetical protein